MAIPLFSKALFTCLIVTLFILYMAEAHKMVNPPTDNNNMVAGEPASIQKIDCKGACALRCKLSSRPHLCNRACGTCCARCSCVPPGTSGGYEACPCYEYMTTRGGRRKCP